MPDPYREKFKQTQQHLSAVFFYVTTTGKYDTIF